jgi:threonyl-tRNA synthetase
MKKLEKQRHSFAHVLAIAILRKNPKAKLGMGPDIENGFYYDFKDIEVNEDDFEDLEKEMKEIIKEDLEFKKETITKKEAKKIFKNQPYKLKLIKDLEGEITIYRTGNFVDLCKGPHVESTGKLNPRAFKLDRTSGAYFKGSEENDMLQRIYGLAFKNKTELNKYLQQREEAKKRDHRKIGKKQELFMFDDEVGQGLPLYLPQGAMLRHLLMDFALNTYLDNGYQLVSTPHIANEKLWQRSGHLDHYADDMYGPLEVDGKRYRLKPMNCPFHVKMYNSKTRSYRELPKRWTEMGTVYRYEKSGELHGLTRPRGFTQDDAHIICRADQLKNEIMGALKLTKYIYSTLGMEDLIFKLSIRDPQKKDDYFGTDQQWEKAENALEDALKSFGKIDYIREEGEAAFYAPKIDIDAVDAMGRRWQLSTIQVDFNLPSRFEMNYINEEGEEETPFMIHRALLGSLERFMGVYIEHTEGKYPVWLSPTQAWIIPISEKQEDYAYEIKDKLRKEGIRVEVEGINETLSKAIRNGEVKQIPYLLVVGDREKESKSVNVRFRSEKKGEMKIEEFIEEVKKESKK